LSEYCINNSLKEINENEYLSVLNKLAKKKWNSVTGKGINLFVKMTKTRNFLLSRGYEFELISTIMKELK
jgi:regulatory protein